MYVLRKSYLWTTLENFMNILCHVECRVNQFYQLIIIILSIDAVKGGGNDGKSDLRQKLEFE